MSKETIMTNRFRTVGGVENLDRVEDKIITVDVGKLRPGSDEYAIIKGILKTQKRKQKTRLGKFKTPKCDNSNKPAKKQRKRRNDPSKVPKEQVVQYPVQVATIFAFNVRKPFVADDFVCRHLSIQTDMCVCCVCFQANALDSMQPIITGTARDCNDFGRIFSIVLNLSESDIISPYCCMQCSDKVLDCFNALLELNLAVCSSLRIHRLDPNERESAPYLCELCQSEMNSQQQLMDHVMLHAVEPLPAHESVQIQQDICDRTPVKISVSESIEEGELVPLNLSGGNNNNNNNSAPPPTTPLILDQEHCYSAKISKSRIGPTTMDENEPETSLCHICGETKGNKGFTRHLRGHLNLGKISPRRNRCPICKVSAVDRLSMHKHLREEHNFDDKLPKKLKKCRLCNLVFSSGKTRSNHEKNEHVVEGFFLCPLCPKKFQFYDGILGHCRLMHPLVLAQSKKIPIQRERRKRKPKKKVDDINLAKICDRDVTINDYLFNEMFCENKNCQGEKCSSGSVDSLKIEAEQQTAAAAQYIVDFINGESYYEELVSTL